MYHNAVIDMFINLCIQFTFFINDIQVRINILWEKKLWMVG